MRDGLSINCSLEIKKPSSCIRLKSSLKLLNDLTEVFIPQAANSKFLLLSKYFTKIIDIRKEL